MLVQGHNLRLLDEARDVGYHPGPENQDSRHMLDQPRGSFPDNNDLTFGVCLLVSLRQVESGILGLVDVSDIFNFFLLGGGSGESTATATGGGGGIFIGNPKGGGFSQERGGGVEGPRGAARVSAGNFGGGGLNIFFGVEIPTKWAKCSLEQQLHVCGSDARTLPQSFQDIVAS